MSALINSKLLILWIINLHKAHQGVVILTRRTFHTDQVPDLVQTNTASLDRTINVLCTLMALQVLDQWDLGQWDLGQWEVQCLKDLARELNSTTHL